jgi:enolase-phosphatase E1
VRLSAGAALIDIEGTIGSIAFVRDVLFPYAAKRMEAFVEAHGDEPSVRAVLDEAAHQAGVPAGDRPAIVDALRSWSGMDAKVTPLKTLQGMIWVEGFNDGEIRGDIYPDALAALLRFSRGGVRLYVYSSGSVAAQKLVFGHSVEGDLLHLFGGFFDTTIGSKLEASSYQRIAAKIGEKPERIVFFSDNAAELDAAKLAGMQAVQLARPSDGVTAAGTHAAVATFDGVEIET